MRMLIGSRGRLVLLLALGTLVFAGQAGAAPGECPTIMPTSEVEEGMVGEGWTVSQGTTPEPFDVTVLGVLENGVGAGRDMIIVETSSPAIDAVGGIWFGMSGSPVYVGGELIGVVAYGLTFAPSPIAGLTPATEIEAVSDYPVAAAAAAPAKVSVPRSLARKVASLAGTSTSAASTFTRLKMPLSVSGIDTRRMNRVNRFAKRLGAEVATYRGASASALEPGDPADIVPGGNFAGALSYGDVTIAGVGTTSYVCDDRAIAFGHPFFALGRTTMGANVADALTIVGDAVFGPFKLATIGGNVGTLDQDRIAGIRALLGTTPESTPVSTDLVSLDTGRSRAGHTDMLVDQLFPDLALFHVFSNIDSVQDAIGEGTAAVDWTLTGTDADGAPWILQRQDVFSSPWDLSIELGFEVADEVWQLNQFRNEGVSIDGLQFGGLVEQTYRTLQILQVLVKRNGVYVRAGSEITAWPGQLVRLRVVLKPSGGGANQLADLRLRMPSRLGGGAYIEIAGGPVEDFFCEFDDCSQDAETFTQVLQRLGEERQHNELGARLLGGLRFVERDSDTRLLTQHVLGSRLISVFPRRGGGTEVPGVPAGR
jgi:SpoIVB peptidase S55